MSISDEVLSTQYPGVSLAYEIALAAYEKAEKRIEAIEGRAQMVLGGAATLTPLALTGGHALKLPLCSLPLMAAAVLFLAGMVVGGLGRVYGSLTMLTPGILYDKWLHKSEWEFKKDLVYFSGEHYEANRQLANLKGRLVLWAAILFFAEAAALALWAVAGT